MYPRWLAWLFVLFLGYIIVTGNRGLTVQENEPQKAARSEQIAQSYPEMHALIDGKRWKRAINPIYVEEPTLCGAPAYSPDQFGSYAILEKEGMGEAARCGDTLQLTLQPWKADGSKATPITATIVMGEQPGLDVLLNGMTLDEVRTVAFVIPKEGYTAIPDLQKNILHLITVTRTK